jgi:hypothetical protein
MGKPLLGRVKPAATATSGAVVDGGPKASETGATTPITEASITGSVRTEETRLDPVAQLEIAVSRLEKENQSLKNQIAEAKARSEALSKECEKNAEAIGNILKQNRGPYGVPMLLYASRRAIINGSCPDNAQFRVWLPEGASATESPDEMTLPNPIPSF